MDAWFAEGWLAEQEKKVLCFLYICISNNYLKTWNHWNPLKCPAYEYASTQDHEEYN